MSTTRSHLQPCKHGPPRVAPWYPYFPSLPPPPLSPPLPTLSVELQMTKSSDYRIDLTERFRRSQAGVGGCRSPSRIAHVFGVRGNLKQSSERCICTGGWEQGTQESGMCGEESAEGNGEERREEREKGDERGKGEWWGKSLNELVLTFFSPLFFFFSPSPSPTFSLFPLSSFLSSSHSFYSFFYLIAPCIGDELGGEGDGLGNVQHGDKAWLICRGHFTKTTKKRTNNMKEEEEDEEVRRDKGRRTRRRKRRKRRRRRKRRMKEVRR